jgi:hypothetical protein
VIVIYDEAQSEAEHTYTQNFLFPNIAADETDKSNITLNIADNFTLKISQFGEETFELVKYNGTTNVNADEKDLRGSRVVGFAKLEKLLNLAYDKRGTSATFLTVLEAHSGGDGEVSVKAVTMNGDVLRVELDNGKIIEEEIQLDEKF